MTISYINQPQYDAIDACVTYMEVVANEVSDFTSAAEVGRTLGVTKPPISKMRAGERQAKLWSLKSSPGFYQFLCEYVDELALFDAYLSAHISALSAFDRKGPVSNLSRVALPPGPSPKYAFSPITNCFNLLQYHQERVRTFAGILGAAHFGYEAIREAIYTVLPRVFDYMSFHLQQANARSPIPKRMNTARQHEHNVRNHYMAGMGAVANFLTQYQRINTLFMQANQHFDELENIKTLSRLKTDMQLIMIKLKQAQHFSLELVELRISR